MASFIPKEDFRFSIRIPVLDALTEGDDEIIYELTREAITEMKGFLNSRYDVAAIFETGGDERDKTILMYCKDIVIYHIYSINNFRSIPENRKLRYKHALQWLQDVNEQKINPEGLPLNTKSLVKTGSNDKRINHQQ
jgi:phage gp36-like protein